MKYIPAGEGHWIEGRGYRKKVLLEASELNCPGALVQIVEIPPGSGAGVHHHKRMTEVFHILQGRGRMTVAGRAVDLVPGDTLTTQPGDDHDAVNTGDETLRYVVFKTNAAEGDSYWEP